MLKLPKIAQSIIWLALICLAWEISSRMGLVSSYMVPPFSAAATRMWQQLFTGNLGVQVFNSLKIVLLGVALSILLSIFVTGLCIMSKLFESFISTVSNTFNTLPNMAILPVFMIWLGIGNNVMLALIVYSVLFPLQINLLAGIRAIPGVYREYARNIQLNPISELTHILIYAILPYFLSGLRQGWGRAWRALIGAEMVFGMIGTMGGLGFYLFMNRAHANVTNVFAGLIIIIIVGILVEQIFNIIEKETIVKWDMSR